MTESAKDSGHYHQRRSMPHFLHRMSIPFAVSDLCVKRSIFFGSEYFSMPIGHASIPLKPKPKARFYGKHTTGVLEFRKR